MLQTSTGTKIALSAVFIIAIVAYALWRSSTSDTATVAIPEETETDQSASTPIEGTLSGTVVAPTESAPKGQYKDGSYTGNATDAFFGIVQVKAVIKGGKLVDVQFLQYPNDVPNTIAISERSIPILKQEAIRIQGANVDIISGATQTTEGFQISLASALLQAKI
jgi:uncharacterized protein with FMN-binding domain